MTQSRSLNSRLAKWTLLFSQYDMKFVPKKETKGQVIANFLVDHLVLENSRLYEAMPNETMESNTTSKESVWQMFFDGVARMGQRGKLIVGAGVVFISPEIYILPYAYSLIEPYSNNVATYNALLIRLQIAEEIAVKYLETSGDSKLIINQIKNEYKVRNESLILYHRATITWTEKFKGSTSTTYSRRIICILMP